MKRVVFGALLFSLGLAAAPRATVANGDETLVLLCSRFHRFTDTQTGILREPTDDGRLWLRRQATADAVELIGGVFCAGVTYRPPVARR